MTQGHETEPRTGVGLTGPAARRTRQGRVGILPNPNRLPLPPPHRPPLTGKWPPLRSSRRPAGGADEADGSGCPPAPWDGPGSGKAVAAGAATPNRDVGSAGRIRIDIDDLNRSVDGLGAAAPARAGFAEALLGDTRQTRRPGNTSAAPDRPESQDEATEGSTGDTTEPGEARFGQSRFDSGRGWRGAWARWLGRG